MDYGFHSIPMFKKKSFMESLACCSKSPIKRCAKKINREPEALKSSSFDIRILKTMQILWSNEDHVAVKGKGDAPNQSWWLTDSVIRNRKYIFSFKFK